MKSPLSNPFWSKCMVCVELAVLLLIVLAVFAMSIHFNPESKVQLNVASDQAVNMAATQIQQRTSNQAINAAPSKEVHKVLSSLSLVEKKRKADPWQVLIHQLEIPTETLKKVAPHFPERFSTNFTNERKAWTQKHVQEVKALLAIPEVKALNPSHIALDIQGLIPRDEIYNPFWYMYNNSGARKAKIEARAPHFPRPDRSLDIEEQERQYKMDFRNWADRYPKEFDAFRELTMN